MRTEYENKRGPGRPRKKPPERCRFYWCAQDATVTVRLGGQPKYYCEKHGKPYTYR